MISHSNAYKLQTILDLASIAYQNQLLTEGLDLDSKALEIAIAYQVNDLIPQLKNRQMHFNYYLSSFYYQNRQLSKAIEYNLKAYAIAQEGEDEEFMAEIRYSLGTCYVQVGKLKEGIVTLSPNLSKNIKINNPYLIFKSLLQWIEIAQQIPVSFDSIKKVHTQAGDLINTVSKNEWKNDLLVHIARFESFRGEFKKSLDIAKEALALKIFTNSVGNGQVYDYHYYNLVRCNLETGHIENAQALIKEWNSMEDQMPENRKVRMNKCKADILYFEKKYNDSYEYANAAVKNSLNSDYEETIFSSLYSIILASLKLQQADIVKRHLKQLYKYRFSERFYVKFYIIIFIGDYSLLVAQTNFKKYKNAKFMYNRARKFAKKIDIILNTSYWTKLVDERNNELIRQMNEKNIVDGF